MTIQECRYYLLSLCDRVIDSSILPFTGSPAALSALEVLPAVVSTSTPTHMSFFLVGCNSACWSAALGESDKHLVYMSYEQSVKSERDLQHLTQMGLCNLASSQAA